MGKKICSVPVFFLSNVMVAFGASDTVATVLAISSLIVGTIGSYYTYRSYIAVRNRGMLCFDYYWC